MKRYITVLAYAAILFAMPAFSQEGQIQSAPPPETAVSAKEEPTQAEELSIYGEVQSVTPSSNSITVQYYDYDSDEEKTIGLIFDKDTGIENAAALSDIKKGDWVDVTYAAIDG